MTKIIFLDVDGVIATPSTLDEAGMWAFTPHCQDNLGWILKETGAKLVISSSWRKHTLEDTIKHFKEEGFNYCDDIIGITVRAYDYIDRKEKIHMSIPRGVEIKQWIDTHIHSDNGKNFNRKKIGVDFNYVILDDSTAMLLEQKDYYIQTFSKEGLTRERAFDAIEKLNYISKD